MATFPNRWLCPGRVTITDTRGSREARCPYVYEDWAGAGARTLVKARRVYPDGQTSSFIGPSIPDMEPCPSHPDLPLKKGRKTPYQMRLEAQNKAFHIIGGNLSIYRDVAKRKSKCRMCFETIMPGEERVAFDSRLAVAQATLNGGLICGRREYVHFVCFIDGLMGGKAGKGCPGCSAKIADREFREYKKSLKEKVGRADAPG